MVQQLHGLGHRIQVPIYVAHDETLEDEKNEL